MIDPIPAIRAIHFASSLFPVGALVFLLCVAQPAFLIPGAAAKAEEIGRFRCRLIRFALWSLIAALISGLFWFIAQAAAMSGRTLTAAFDAEILGTVWRRTLFGRVWNVRLFLALILGGLLILRPTRAKGAGRPGIVGASAFLAAAFAATLAWAGHAAATRGTAGVLHLAADVVHLVATGAWLGGLVPLAILVEEARRGDRSTWTEAVRQAALSFSTLALCCVGTLVFTGMVNAWFLVGSVPALLGTPYGRTLLLKIALFLAAIVIGSVNRFWLLPQMIGNPCADDGIGQSGALRRLRRNVVLETVVGIAVLAAVGTLGYSVPAAHVAPIWPFPYTLGAEGLVPAYPTTYQKNPERYSAMTISRGAGLYAAHCAVCHGEHGYGDGPAADALSARPANLVSGHLAHHTDGDLFWWISRGIAGTPMPGFAVRIDETGRWDLVAFLHAQADAEAGRSLTPSVEPWRPLVAPDFPFEAGSGAQASLSSERGRSAVLLVLFTAPESLPRLRELQAESGRIERAGARIVAAPIDDPTRAAAPFPAAGPEAAASYGLFRRAGRGTAVPAMPRHMEFLIDRQGYLRARWIPDGRAGWSPVPGLLRELDRLAHEPPRPPAPRTTPHEH